MARRWELWGFYGFGVLCVARSGVRGALRIYGRFWVEVRGMGYCFGLGLGFFVGW